MKVLLLYPEFPDTFWSFKHALKFIRKKAALLRSPNYFRAGAACRIEASGDGQHRPTVNQRI
jgi:hypothetical protein